MEKFVEELKKNINFKNTTDVGDIVLIAAHEPQMLVYALVTGIERDKTKRDEWWHVDLHLLSIPPQPVTWILRTEQITGQEIFTMGGESRFIKAIALPNKHPEDPLKGSKQSAASKKTRLHVVK